MRNILLTIACVFALISNTYSQTNPGINYQAVARDASANLLANQAVSVRFSIIEDSPTGNMLYSESQLAMTNEYGLFTLSIGNGSILSGKFSQIDWSGGNIYLKVEIDENAGNNYEVVGTTKFMYVPFALYAEKSGSGGSSEDYDTDSTNEIQTLIKEGNQIILSKGGGSITDSVDDADSDPENELQTLTYSNDTFYSNDTLRLSLGGGEVIIAKGATKLDELSDTKTDITSVFIGAGAGYKHYLPDKYNTSVGIETLYFNTIGYENTATGAQTLYSNITGSENTATGSQALYSNTTGVNNTATGMKTLYLNTYGSFNTATGRFALYSNTTGDFNTATGRLALYSNTTGKNNTATGAHALYSNTTGRNNTAVGYLAYNLGNYDNSTALGYGSSISKSNMVGIGNTSITSIGGQVNWTSLSDGRYKFNLRDNVKGLDFILKLHPVTYQMNIKGLAEFLGEDKRFDESTTSFIIAEPDEFIRKSREEKSQIRYSGFVAQEVEQAANEVGYEFSGVDAPQNEQSLYGLRYAEFVIPLVKAVQEQQEIIEEQNQRIVELQRQIDELKNAIGK